MSPRTLWCHSCDREVALPSVVPFGSPADPGGETEAGDIGERIHAGCGGAVAWAKCHDCHQPIDPGEARWDAVDSVLVCDECWTDPGMCSRCYGSGEGSRDGSRCWACHGRGTGTPRCIAADDGPDYEPYDYRIDR